jgi:DNA (cytosine-5)-methyltransferase 1
MIRIGSLCSGYGGLEHAVAAALGGVSTAWHAEVDPAAAETLAKHEPGTPNHGDITAIDWSTVEPVDLLAMGVPCQPASAAGRQLGDADPRWLWPHALRAITALRPPVIVFENVRNLISIKAGALWVGILADLRAAGYAVRWLTVGACAVGAPHHRHRVFLLAAYVGADAPPAVRVAMDECGARRGALLASPLARDGEGRNEGDAAYWERKRAAGFTGGMPLGAQVTLLPSPRASDAKNGGPNQGIASGDIALSSAVIGERWGRYAAAVARWEGASGVLAPEPTEIGPRGGRRLAPALPEWMMGLTPGYLTGHLARGDALRLAGNGVCPAQGAYALDILLSPRSG